MKNFFVVFLFLLVSACQSPVSLNYTDGDSAAVAADLAPATIIQGNESLITLSYVDKEMHKATACYLTSLTHLTITTPCTCDALSGVCQVGVTNSAKYNGPASFEYSVSTNGLTSNFAQVNFTIKPQPFITIWRMGNMAYGNGNNTLNLPLPSGFNYNFTVDWGDGSALSTVTAFNDTDRTHIYTAPGDYTVSIEGLVESWYSVSATDRNKLIEVVDLGEVGWISLYRSFSTCSRLVSFAGGMTKNVTSMDSMFEYTPALINADVSSFDTSSVTNMRGMFSSSSALTSLDLSNFDTSIVTTMKDMFNTTSSLSSLNISSFDTSSVLNMSAMFNNTFSLTILDLNHFNTAAVTDMSYMFTWSSITSLQANNWDIGGVVNSTSIWDSTNAGLMVYCDQGMLFGETCN